MAQRSHTAGPDSRLYGDTMRHKVVSVKFFLKTSISHPGVFGAPGDVWQHLRTFAALTTQGGKGLLLACGG